MTNQQQSPSLNNSPLKALLNSSDPKSFIQNMIKGNPQAQNLINTMNTSGLTPKQFFYQYAQNNGVNPEQFLKTLQ